MYGSLCELLMQNMSVRKVLRVGHSAKFCKKMKVWDGPGQWSSILDAKLLLLVQNEVGQIVGHRLTRSENNDESSALLEAVKPILKPDGNYPIYLVSDNANGVRGMVQTTFENIVHVKQDPFHAMLRVKEKIADKAKKWCISKELISAMYTVERELRPPQGMKVQFRRVASSIAPKELSCTEAIWRGCIDSSAAQIRSGDLYGVNNDYTEAHTTTRVVATSQLEGFHSGPKKLLNR
ncbi:hypothetical protein PF003_g21472 [Phytophthora fragariae]|nr:hypothetical protein PF003_g21472 [Phytophthora fragariae]